MSNISNVSNTSYGQYVGTCFYVTPEVGFDSRKKMVLGLSLLSLLCLGHMIYTYQYSYVPSKQLQRKLDDLGFLGRTFNFGKADGTGRIPKKYFQFPVALLQHGYLMSFLSIFGNLIPIFIGSQRKTLCEMPFLCKFTTFLVYYTYNALTICVVFVGLAINRLVLDPKMKMNKRANQEIRAKLETPAIISIYIGQFILALIPTFGAENGPMWNYCGVQKPMAMRMFFFGPLVLYAITEAFLILPVCWHFIQEIRAAKKQNSQKSGGGKDSVRARGEKRKIRIIKKLSLLVLVHCGIIIGASLRRVLNSLRYNTYEELAIANKGDMGFPTTEFTLSGVGLIIYIILAVLDDQFHDASFWRYLFKKSEEQRQKDMRGTKVSSSTEAASQ